MPPEGSGVKFSLSPSDTNHTLPQQQVHKELFREAKGNRKIDVLVELVSDGVFWVWWDWVAMNC